jgi:protein TonB
MMVANSQQPTLPWMASHTEDRRFRLILVLVLAVCFVIGGVVPTIPLPLLEREMAADLPPRLVRIIEDRYVTPTPKPAAPRAEASQPVAQEPISAPQPESQKAADAKPPAVKPKPVPTAREKAAQAGVLAMSDALDELRGISPKTGNTAAGSAAAGGNSPQKTQKPSVLAADITRGSAGIDSGVAHQTVLGASGLPDKKASSGPALLSAAGISPAGSGATRSPHSSGLARSQEEIQEILDRNKGAMYALYNRELRQDPTLQGKLIISITIAPSGRVTRCTIIDSELDAASLEKQLIRLVKRIDFGNKSGAPVVTTKVPIEFFPQ